MDFAFTSAFASMSNRQASTRSAREAKWRAVSPLREHAESYIVQNETKAARNHCQACMYGGGGGGGGGGVGGVGGVVPAVFCMHVSFRLDEQSTFLDGTCTTTISTRSKHERRPSSTRATRLQAARLCSSAHLGRGAYPGYLVIAFTSAFASMSNRQTSKSA